MWWTWGMGLTFLLCQCWLAHVLTEAPPCCLEKNTRSRNLTHPEGESSLYRENIPIMEFPWFPKGLSRRKRDWVIPPISFPENDRGPYPKVVVQIKSSNDNKIAITYRITGPGADQPPEGLFTVDKRSGMMFVTKPLDREVKHEYKLMAHALTVGMKAEEPMEIIIKVIDQNDNKPEFTHHPFHGRVSESASIDHSFMRIKAVDKDDPETDNGIVRYRIWSQAPEWPRTDMFAINPVSGVLSVVSGGLDRETHPEYKLVIEAADMEGRGLTASCTAIITVTDSNDNAPQFTMTTYSVSVRENELGVEVARLKVTDLDEPGSPMATTRYSIIEGNKGGHFNVSAGLSKMEGVLTTVKELDYESCSLFTLLVVVENEVVFSGPVSTSTATVTVTVEDRNEAPVFRPAEKHVKKSEDAPVGSIVADYRAIDPDTATKQSVRYQLVNDFAKWLSINKDTGLVKIKNHMDRESKSFVRDGKYTVTISAYDNDTVPATGTGTLVVELVDVNDNPPLISQRHISLCREDPSPALLDITDQDGPGNAGPFTVELQGEHRTNWTIANNSTSGVATLAPRRALSPQEYNVLLRVYDAGMLYQDSTLQVEVCQCRGPVSACFLPSPKSLTDVSTLSVGVLGATFGMLLLLLLLLLFLRKRSSVKRDVWLQEDEARDNIYHYDEMGGGEEDREYDLGQLHRGLDDRPEVFCTDVAPMTEPLPRYRLRPQQNETIGDFIEDNLHAADADTTAPPYDCLLVFDYEGGGSWEGSLSSINSSSSEEDPDYQRLAHWGPRFSRLADMYIGREEEDTDTDTLPGKTEWV